MASQILLVQNSVPLNKEYHRIDRYLMEFVFSKERDIPWGSLLYNIKENWILGKITDLCV